MSWSYKNICMQELLLSMWIKFCTDMLESWKKCSNGFMGNCIDGLNKLEDIHNKNNIYYFNGYLKGYEAAVRDYNGINKIREPAELYF